MLPATTKSLIIHAHARTGRNRRAFFLMNSIIKKADNRPKTFGSVVDELFQTNLNRFFDDRTWGFNGLQAEGRVPVNIQETDTTYEVEVVAPGLKKEDFQLSYTGDLLTISFEHSGNKTSGQDEKWIRREFRAASFSRSFQVDGTVDVDKSKARYENGVLLLTLPKKEEAKRISAGSTYNKRPRTNEHRRTL